MENTSEVIIETEEYMDVCVGPSQWTDKNGVPIQKHDGNLDNRNDCVVAHDDCTTAYGLGGVFRGVSIISRWVGGGVDMTPQQALSLLAWLRQEEECRLSQYFSPLTNNISRYFEREKVKHADFDT